jgi:hypothetical protein
MFSAFAFGGFLFVTGAIGLDVSRLRGLFDSARWVDGPIWWQTALGLALILLGVHWFRRIAGPR